ncbi:putative integral membrane protein [Acanthocheilonema viteae]
MLSSSITLSSLVTLEESQETGENVELPNEPISPQYVIPITPINASPILIPSFTSYGTASHETNFDHNDVKYQCCHGYMHITLAARIISIVYLCGAVFIVFLTACSQGATLAFYSIASFAFAFSIFGTLAYGIFKEKQIFILPYIIFQITSVICTLIIIFIFIVGSMFSNKMLSSLAADLGGMPIDNNVNTSSDFPLKNMKLIRVKFNFYKKEFLSVMVNITDRNSFL